MVNGVTKLTLFVLDLKSRKSKMKIYFVLQYHTIHIVNLDLSDEVKINLWTEYYTIDWTCDPRNVVVISYV